MRKAILAIVVFALMGCLQGPAGENGKSSETQTASIPSLNLWMASLDTTHRAHILVTDKRYYDPNRSAETEHHQGSAVWKTKNPSGAFSIYAAHDGSLVEIEESCVFPDTMSSPAPQAYYQRRRVISQWFNNNGEIRLSSSYPNGCPASQLLDSIVTSGYVKPVAYLVDSVIAVDAKGFRYVESIDYYYLAGYHDSTLREEGRTYSFDAGGFIMGRLPFLGEYRVYY